MPRSSKQLHELKRFQTGTVTTPSERDVPEDCASYSKNLDSVTEDGVLKGVPNDKTLLTGGTATGWIQIDSITEVGFRRIDVNGAGFFMSSSSSASGVNFYEGTSTSQAATNLASALNASTHPYVQVATYVADGNKVNITYDSNSAEGNNFSLADYDATYSFSGPFLTGGGGHDLAEMAFINDEGKYHLVGFVSTDDSIAKYEDFNTGTPIRENLGTVQRDTVSFERHNKELHIGTGNLGDTSPKWVGIPQNKTFTGVVQNKIEMLDAECSPPAGNSFYYKTVTDGTHIYGVQWKGDTVYKINSSGSIVAKSSLGTFKDIRGIAYGNSKLWIYERSDSTKGDLYNVSTSNMTIAFQCPLSDYSQQSNSWISDIYVTANKIWFAHSMTDYGGDKDNLLWNANIPTASSQLTLTNRTPDLSGNYWKRAMRTGSNVSYSNGSGQTFEKTFKLSLMDVKNNTSAVAWICKYAKTTYEEGEIEIIQPLYGDSGTPENIDISDDSVFQINIIDESYSGSGRVNGIYNFEGDLGGSSLNSLYADTSDVLVTAGNKIKKYNVTLNNLASGAVDTLVSTGASPTSATQADSAISCITSKLTISSTDYYIINTLNKSAKVSKITTNLATESDVLSANVYTMSISNISGSGNFPESKTFTYKCSFIYDGYQESPLSETAYTTSNGSGVTSNRTLTISWNQKDMISKRVSHVCIYRNVDDGYYRLVEDVSIDDARWSFSGDAANLVIIDKYKLGQSYEARTGISEVVIDTIVHYGLSTQINNQMIVGKCYHKQIEGASNYLFKSKPYRYDIYDWSADVLRLPEEPTALKAFNGRVYAFTNYQMFRIDPEAFIIEDIHDGVGCLNQNSIVVTEFGMFFADNHNIFFHDGTRAIPIGDPILRDRNGFGWQDGTKSNVVASFDPRRNSAFLFFTQSNAGYAWAYNMPRKRWDLLEAPKAEGLAIADNGRIIISTGSNLYDYLSGTGTRDWEYQSKNITLGADTQDKFWYKIRGVGSHSDIPLSYQKDGSGSWVTVSNEQVASSDRRFKSIRIKATNRNGNPTDELDSIGIIYKLKDIR